MKTIYDIKYGQDKLQAFDIYLPDAESFPVFIYFHGGGLEAGDKADYIPLCEYFASHGVAVVNANYRMYPTARYPDFLEDAAQVVAQTFADMKKYGNIEGIYVGGSSAGGYISQMLCFNKQLLAAHGLSPMDISGFVHDAGQPTCHFNILRERKIDTRRVMIDDSASLYHVGADENYPRMLIIVSDNDMQNRYEQTMLLMSTLKHFGHEDKISFKLMHGEHCAYVSAKALSGESIFGKMVCDFIKGE